MGHLGMYVLCVYAVLNWSYFIAICNYSIFNIIECHIRLNI